MIGVVDYGMGNIGSVMNILKRLRADARVVSVPEEAMQCDKLILPGVGAYDAGVQRLQQQGWWPVLQVFGTELKRPVFGICLGMQLMCQGSEEGVEAGLGWFPFVCKRLQPGRSADGQWYTVPHMGWKSITVLQPDFPLLQGHPEPWRFYFVHSFAITDTQHPAIAATASFAEAPFAAVLWQEHLFGFQCHPEKSHQYGLAVYQQFINL